MKKLLSISFASLLLVIICSFSLCKKEYSYEGGGNIPGPTTPPGNAVFTLPASQHNCNNAFVDGRYTIGVALASNNKIIVEVDVASIGPYVLKTDTLDGISFSASGTFTTTGLQSVALVGSGIPAYPANLQFTILNASAPCKIPVTVSNPEPLATYVLESGFGDPNPCVYTVNGTFTSSVPLSNANNVSIRVYVTYAGNFTVATNRVNGMMFSYTGTFSTTGIQNVILNGTGTPVNAGAYKFIPEIVGPHPLGGASCAFDVTVQ